MPSTDTRALARHIAAVADALAQYDHLPPIDLVGNLSLTSRPVLHPAHSASAEDRLRALAQWAAAFAVPVTIDRQSGSVTTVVQLAGIDCELYVGVGAGRAAALLATLGVPWTNVLADMAVAPFVELLDAQAVARG